MLKLDLDMETVSCGLLQEMARMDVDWNSVQNLGQLFQVLMLSLQKSPKKVIIVGALW